MRGDLGLQKQTLNLYIGSFNIYKKKKEAQKPKRKYDKKKGGKRKATKRWREKRRREKVGRFQSQQQELTRTGKS